MNTFEAETSKLFGFQILSYYSPVCWFTEYIYKVQQCNDSCLLSLHWCKTCLYKFIDQQCLEYKFNFRWWIIRNKLHFKTNAFFDRLLRNWCEILNTLPLDFFSILLSITRVPAYDEFPFFIRFPLLWFLFKFFKNGNTEKKSIRSIPRGYFQGILNLYFLFPF